MAVGRRVLRIVLDLDVVPIAVHRTDPGDHAIAGGEYRRTDRGGEIDAAVHLAVAEDRILAHSERRGDADHVEGRAQEILADALALGVEEVGDAILRLIAIDFLGRAADDQGGIEHVAAARQPTLLVLVALVEDLEAIARLDLALEVDVIAERLDDLRHDLHRDGRILAGLEEARIDDAAGERIADLQRMVDGRCNEAATGALDDNVALETGLQAEAGQLHTFVARHVRREVVDVESDGLPRLQVAGLEHIGEGIDRGGGLGRANARSEQDVEQRVALLHLDDLQPGVRQLRSRRFRDGLGARFYARDGRKCGDRLGWKRREGPRRKRNRDRRGGSERLRWREGRICGRGRTVGWKTCGSDEFRSVRPRYGGDRRGCHAQTGGSYPAPGRRHGCGSAASPFPLSPLSPPSWRLSNRLPGLVAGPSLNHNFWYPLRSQNH